MFNILFPTNLSGKLINVTWLSKNTGSLLCFYNRLTIYITLAILCIRNVKIHYYIVVKNIVTDVTVDNLPNVVRGVSNSVTKLV